MPAARKQSSNPDLLNPAGDALRPLAERMRPRMLDDMVGQRRRPADGARYSTSGVRGGSASSSSSESVRASLSSMMGMPSRMG